MCAISPPCLHCDMVSPSHPPAREREAERERARDLVAAAEETIHEEAVGCGFREREQFSVVPCSSVALG